jgi:hypothetical protein
MPVRFPPGRVARGRSALGGRFPSRFKETGFVEGQNVAIEYRWAQGQYDRLSELAADLVRRQVALIAAPVAILRRRWQRRQPEPFPSCSLPMAIPSEWPGSKSQPAGRQCRRYHHIRRSRGHPAPAAAARTRAEPTTSAWDQCSLREKTLDVGGPPHMRLCLLINSARHHVNDRQ